MATARALAVPVDAQTKSCCSSTGCPESDVLEESLYTAIHDDRESAIKQVAEQHAQLRSLRKEAIRHKKHLHIHTARGKNLEGILGQRDEAKIMQTRQDIKTTTEELAKTELRCKQLEADIALNTNVQLRCPGAVHLADVHRESESFNVATKMDVEYVVALKDAFDAIERVPLDVSVLKVGSFLKQEMTKEQYIDEAKDLASGDYQVYEDALKDWLQYVQDLGRNPAIRTYTAQRFPVFSAVAQQMVNRETRYVNGALSHAVKECMHFQVLLDSEVKTLPIVDKFTVVYRGIPIKFGDLRGTFPLEEEKIFYEPKSFSFERAQAENFAGPDGTLLVLTALTARDITDFSFFPSEREAFVAMFTRVKVTHSTRGIGSCDEVHLREVEI